MKILILNCLILIIANSVYCKKRVNTTKNIYSNAYKKDSVYYRNAVQEYKADRCLYDMLKALTTANKGFYPINKYYYSLSIEQRGKMKFLNISMGLWKDSKNLHYKGVIKFIDGIFLCTGDIESDLLFKKDGVKKTFIELRASKNVEIIPPYNIDPSFEGVYNDCKGLPLYIEIYTKAKIEGYGQELP